jgi:HD-GYP domain-containing protein (c-di-GMP phosphodiesterase class II)
VVLWLSADVALAAEALRLRSGTALDPKLAKKAIALLPAFAAVDRNEAWLADVERLLRSTPLTLGVETVAVTFGDFSDLQSPFTRGHSRRVARLALEAARDLGVQGEERVNLGLAAHLHDLGHVAVPTGIWLRRRWSPEDRERATTHPLITERILKAAVPFAEAARIAGAHHERLDGQGYHRRLSQTAIGRTARILAAADVACALGEDRPQRPALKRDQVRKHLLEEVVARRLDGDCVNAVLRAMGESRVAALPGPVAKLTSREVEVLRLLALGQTNKQIARTLGISDRTVQHHTIHIYEKLEVDTRAAAALLASRHGLI